MRVTFLVDGKNFHAGWRHVTRGGDLNFRLLAQWIVGATRGTLLAGSHYNTGVDGSFPLFPAQVKLENQPTRPRTVGGSSGVRGGDAERDPTGPSRDA